MLTCIDYFQKGLILDTPRYINMSRHLSVEGQGTRGLYVCRIEIATSQAFGRVVGGRGLVLGVGAPEGHGNMSRAMTGWPLRPQRSMGETFCGKSEVWLVAAR